MIKETVKYTDFDGNEREEEFCFHFSKAELVEMQMSEEGGLDQLIQRIVDEKDNAKLVALFKTIILKAYGIKTPDGRGFYKDPQATAAFEYTEAYSELFMSLITDTDKAVDFIRGVMPNIAELNDKLDEKVAELKAENKVEEK